MPNLTIPVDGRPQFEPSTVMISNAMMGRWPLTAGVEAIVPGGKYILQDTWPKPPTTNRSFSSSVAASQTAPAVATPRSSAAARAIWPNLP
jgi:hypothetical protein